MKIKSAEFVISNTDIKKCPEPTKPEFAFIGRSNVGKSSLINMLMDKKALAKVSGTPGKTQLINHFIINEEWYLVDLPGYGYAKTSKSNRQMWSKFINQYILTRTNLMCVVVLIDSRIEAQKNDTGFMKFLGENGIPFVMVFTKIDKLSSSALGKNVAAYKREMLKTWEFLPQIFTTSASSSHGRESVLKFIEETLPLYES